LIYKGYIYRDSYNRYYENIISYNYKGIDISNCNHCNVYRNYIHNNRGGGIIIWGALNIITNNDIRNSSRGILLDTSYLGKIEKNNFINNTQNAFFIQSHRFGFSNQWKRNYWDDWGGIGPELISGRLVITDPDNPYDPPKYRDLRNYDWFPARKPYKITFTNNIEGCGIE
jgi:parallel beta-helix repeat protein